MDSGGRSSDAPRIEGGSIFRSPKELRPAASKSFLENGRGFTAGNGGGHLKTYRCSGRPPVAKRAKKQKKTKPGAPPSDPSMYWDMATRTRSYSSVLIYGYRYESLPIYMLLLLLAQMVRITSNSISNQSRCSVRVPTMWLLCRYYFEVYRIP